MSARAPSDFLGTGWSFPPSFTKGGAQVDVVSDADDVHQSLQILLATLPTERPLQRNFGCDLASVLFEHMDQKLVNRVTTLVNDAILNNEPRINLRNVDVSPGSESGVLEIRVEYQIRGTNSRYNMVFPFFINEAVSSGL